MPEIKNKILDELLVTTKDGDWGRESPSDGYVPYHVIRGADFAAARVHDVRSVPVRYLAERTVARRTLQANDVLIETAGGTSGRPTGRTLLVTCQLLDQFNYPVTCASFARFLRVDEAIVDPRYLFWFLQGIYSAGEMLQHQVQHTGVARFQFRRFSSSRPIPLPSIESQRAIAEMLGALDDKITTNVKLASTARKLAEIEFAAIVRGIGFSEKTFADIAAVGGGGTPRTGVGEYWDGEIDWATPTDVTALVGPYMERTARRITYSGLDACASALYPAGSILMTSRATIGAFAIAQRPMAVNQGFIVVNPHDADLSWWMYHEMHSRVDEFLSLANGATFLELSRGNFKKFRVRLADSIIMKDFGAQAKALHARGRGALVENSVLAAMRDLLLPQLMSGKVRVKDAEKTVEEVL